VEELTRWEQQNGTVRLGAGVSYTRTIAELGDKLPGLAMAARTVGSPQIRNRGTVAGNLGAASPAGDSHPALLAADAVALQPDQRRVGTGIGSAAPTPRRARDAEQYVGEALDAGGYWDTREPVPDTVATRFGDLVASASSPIDDVRGSARYRQHALSVMARRALLWAWNEYREG
jgi:CO/xanthine dehydrogenase FAD-binding subunit